MTDTPHHLWLAIRNLLAKSTAWPMAKKYLHEPTHSTNPTPAKPVGGELVISYMNRGVINFSQAAKNAPS
jgi:hypothetical protein